MIRRPAALCLAVVLLGLAGRPSSAQDDSSPETHDDGNETAQHEFHPNHFGGLVGVTTHHNINDSGLTVGLEYARQFSKRWAVTSYLELVSSDLERDVVLAIGAAYYPFDRVALILAGGAESATRSIEEHGEVAQETELAFILRTGIGYSFPLTPEATAGPILLVDHARDRWTTLFALGMIVGF